jgi:hypothetical protein
MGGEAGMTGGSDMGAMIIGMGMGMIGILRGCGWGC